MCRSRTRSEALSEIRTSQCLMTWAGRPAHPIFRWIKLEQDAAEPARRQGNWRNERKILDYGRFLSKTNSRSTALKILHSPATRSFKRKLPICTRIKRRVG